jgi:hypothetical protein
MAIKQFALPLNEDSKQTGDITVKELSDNQATCVFRISHVICDSTLELNLITKKNNTIVNHVFAAVDESGSAAASVSAAQLEALYEDADNGNWDYVEARWTVRDIDNPSTSALTANQLGNVDNLFGWPPNK